MRSSVTYENPASAWPSAATHQADVTAIQLGHARVGERAVHHRTPVRPSLAAVETNVDHAEAAGLDGIPILASNVGDAHRHTGQQRLAIVPNRGADQRAVARSGRHVLEHRKAAAF